MSRIYTPSSFSKKVVGDNYEKGRLFEEYIINLFSKKFFYQKQWRKSQEFDDSYAVVDPWNPDIEMDLVFAGKRNYRFAVECKWQARFYNGKISWAKDHQICAYRIFQDRVRIPVFVAIGIGGEPNNPEKLFLTPLNNISDKIELSEKELNPFERNPRHRFYYDYTQLKLF